MKLDVVTPSAGDASSDVSNTSKVLDKLVPHGVIVYSMIRETIGGANVTLPMTVGILCQ